LKRFIKKLTIFILLFAVILYCVNFVYYKNVSSKALIERKWKEFAEVKDDIDILIFGDSHAQGGLNPKFIERSFNFAIGSQLYYGDYYKLKMLLETQNIQPKAIILPYDYPSFVEWRWRTFVNNHILGTAWHWSKYIDLVELMSVKKDLNILEMKIKRFFPFVGNWKEFFYPKKKISEVYMGHRAPPWKVNKQLTNGVIKTQGYTSVIKYKKVDADAILYLNKILELAKGKDMKVILIKFPMYEDYYYAAEEYTPSYYELIESQLALDDSVHILDMQAAFIGHKDYFRDQFHVNPDGAKALSELVSLEMKRIQISIFHYCELTLLFQGIGSILT